MPKKVQQLLMLKGIGINSAWLFVMEFFGWRALRNRKEVGALSGLTPTPYASGTTAYEQGIAKAGKAHIRAMAIEIAWGWLRFQPPERAAPVVSAALWPRQSSPAPERDCCVGAEAAHCLVAVYRDRGRTGRCGSQSDGASLTTQTVALRDGVGVGSSRGDRVRIADRS